MAGFMLIVWPFVAIGLFAGLGPARGLIWSVALGYLFLPERYAFDIPALPPYHKYTAISLAALLGVMLFRNREPRDAEVIGKDTILPKLLIALLVLLVVSPLGTWMTNPEPLINGSRFRNALSSRDFVSMVTDSVIMIMPMVLAWRVLYRKEHHRELLIALVVLGLVYSMLVLFEWRISPQLNIWIYGYFQHEWLQHVRGGGFRPIVFLQHGLTVGFFLLTATLAAFALARSAYYPKSLMIMGGCWLFLVLTLSRNFGALGLAILLIPLTMLIPLKLQFRLTVIVALLFLLYPVLKQSGLSPDVWLNEQVAKYSAERAHSFGWRIRNEVILLERALEKPLFGWGGWSRMRVYDEFGRDISTVDGIWVVTIGQRGWVGFIAQFGLVVAPILFMGRALKRKALTPYIGGMLVILMANLIDMIPNSTLSPLAFLMIGAMAAFVQFDMRTEDQTDAVTPENDRADRQHRYSRFPQGGEAVATPYRRQI